MSSEHLLVENFNLGNDENREHPPLPAHYTTQQYTSRNNINNQQTETQTDVQTHRDRDQVNMGKDREFRKQMTQKIYVL